MTHRTNPHVLMLLFMGLTLLASCSGRATMQTASTSPSSSGSSGPSAAATEQRPAPRVMLAPTASSPAVEGALPVAAPIPYYPPPGRIDLCGEPVPLHYDDVRERFDKEFTLVVYNHAQVYLWLKRMERYFPWIEERLRYHQLPDDLKYVAIVESDLLPNACSPKGAAGPWQFMPSTGASYGLDRQGSCDERYDFERATDSAFRLMNDLHKRYRSWSLALAAYNCGDKRLLDEMRSQSINDYYLLKLPIETERYVFRVLAIKAVLSNPNQYGYHLPKGQGYQEFKVDRVNVNLSNAISIQTIASAAGTTYREFKRLNPVFRANSVPAGSHELKLPPGTGAAFEQNFETLRAQALPEDPSPAMGDEDEESEDTGRRIAMAKASEAPYPAQRVKERTAEPKRESVKSKSKSKVAGKKGKSKASSKVAAAGKKTARKSVASTAGRSNASAQKTKQAGVAKKKGA